MNQEHNNLCLVLKMKVNKIPKNIERSITKEE